MQARGDRVIVKFRTNELLKAYQDLRYATKLWNEKIARLYAKRVDLLQSVKSAHELLMGHVFGFEGKSKGTPLAGKFTMRLDGFYRLVLSFEDDARTIVVIEEVSKHYCD